MRIYVQDIRREFGLEKCAMLIMKSRKRQTTEGIEQPNQRKNQNTRRKRNYKKTSGNQTIKQKSYERDKHLDWLPCNILGTILNVDKEGTSNMDERTRKLTMMHKTLHLTMTFTDKQRGRGLTSLEDSIGVSLRWLEAQRKTNYCD